MNIFLQAFKSRLTAILVIILLGCVLKYVAHQRYLNRLLQSPAIQGLGQRGFRGGDHLDTFLAEAHVSWSDVVWLSTKVNAPSGYLFHRGSSAEHIIIGTVETLCSMAHRGEDIQAFKQQLTLASEQKIALDSAPLTPIREADLLSDYILNMQVIRPEGDWLILDHFKSLGSVGKERFDIKLQDFLAHPEKYSQSSVRSSVLFEMTPEFQKWRISPPLLGIK